MLTAHYRVTCAFLQVGHRAQDCHLVVSIILVWQFCLAGSAPILRHTMSVSVMLDLLHCELMCFFY